jgi:hypothetical protein
MADPISIAACQLGRILKNTFFGIPLLIDTTLKPTCFEIR